MEVLQLYNNREDKHAVELNSVFHTTTAANPDLHIQGGGMELKIFYVRPGLKKYTYNVPN